MELFGIPAIKVPAKQIMWGVTEKAKRFKIGENEHWIPNTVCRFIKDDNQGDPLSGNGNTKGSLIINKWYWDKYLKS